MNDYMHQYGAHTLGSNGGAYNATWQNFYSANSDVKNSSYLVIGFGVGLFDHIAPRLIF